MNRTQEQLDKLYADHERLMYDRAWFWAKRTGREVSDLMGPCADAFTLAVRWWKPNKGTKFSSTLHTFCDQRIGMFCAKTDLPPAEEHDPDREQGGCWLPAWVRWQTIRELVSGETRDVIDTIIAASTELIEMCGNDGLGTLSLRRAAKLLLFKRGYCLKGVMHAMREIKTTLKEV